MYLAEDERPWKELYEQDIINQMASKITPVDHFLKSGKQFSHYLIKELVSKCCQIEPVKRASVAEIKQYLQ